LKKLTTIPEVSYLLAFAPAGKPDATMHKLKVRLKNGGSYHADSRTAYFPLHLLSPKQPPSNASIKPRFQESQSKELPHTSKIVSGRGRLDRR